jgi:hypothetical protein
VAANRSRALADRLARRMPHRRAYDAFRRHGVGGHRVGARGRRRFIGGRVSRPRSKASARRPVSRVLSHRRAEARRRGWPSICVRRSPDGSCGRPEGWAAHLSPAPVTRCGLRPPIWPCSGWSLPRFTPPSDPRAGRRHRHCGTGPRLTTDGRYPPPCAEELGLSSPCRQAAPPAPRDHPTASLTARFYSALIRSRPWRRAAVRSFQEAPGRRAIDPAATTTRRTA